MRNEEGKTITIARMYVPSSFIAICVITLAIVPINAADLKRLAFPENAGHDTTSHVTRTRWPRSVLGIRGSVVRMILRGTQEAETRSTGYRKYFKQGTEFDAVSDFKSLKLKVIRKTNYGAIGFSGKTKVKLTLKNKTNTWLPTMQVSDPNMDKSIKIVYVNKPIE